jgi:hypothetical protein
MEHGIFLDARHEMYYNYMKNKGLFGLKSASNPLTILLDSFFLIFRTSILIFHF